jgi:hypothetical protein
MEYLFVTLVLATVLLLLIIAQNTSGGVRFTLYILSFYWGASYVLRPIFFLYARDNDIDNKIFDTRIGKSTDTFISVMQNIVIGNIIFCLVTFVIVSRTQKRRQSMIPSKFPQLDTKILNVTLTVAVLSTLIERTVFQNPVSKSLASLVSFSLCAFLWNRKGYIVTKTNTLVLFCVGLATLLLISEASGHFKGIILTPLLIFTYKLEVWKNQKNLVVKISIFIFLLLSFIPFFSFLQNQKLGSSTTKRFLNNSSEFPWFLEPFLNLAVRFDQFARITDANFAGPGILGGWKAWIDTILVSLQWNPATGREDISFGQMWNQQVTNASIPGAKFSPVSLAQGMIAEGWIWKGLISLVVECALMALLFNIIGRLLDGNFVCAVTGFALIGNGTIFESGVIQTTAKISAALKNLLFILLLRALLKTKAS